MKEIKTILKLQIKAGQANPAPPLGPALASHGINIADFCNKFNQQTKDLGGDLVSVELKIYKDRSFDFKIKTPPTSYLLKKAAGIEKGSGEPHKTKVGKVTRADLIKIAERKLPDLNTDSIEQAIKIVEGTAKQMGIEIIEE